MAITPTPAKSPAPAPSVTPMANSQTASVINKSANGGTSNAVAPSLDPAYLANLQKQAGAANQNLQGARSTLTDANSRAAAAPNSTSAIRVLEEALRMKTDSANIPLGESKIFEQAGVTGIGALASSLSARGEEMKQNYARYSNFVTSMFDDLNAFNKGTVEAAQYALENYKVMKDEYDTITERLYDIENDALDFEKQLQLLEVKDQIDRETFLFKERNKYRSGGGGGGSKILTASQLTTARSNYLKIYPKGTIAEFNGLPDEDKIRYYDGRLSSDEVKTVATEKIRNLQGTGYDRKEAEKKLHYDSKGDYKKEISPVEKNAIETVYGPKPPGFFQKAGNKIKNLI